MPLAKIYNESNEKKEMPMKEWAEWFGKMFMAITFAEANCHDMAVEVLGGIQKPERITTLDLFLENVGLSHTRICYVAVRV